MNREDFKDRARNLVLLALDQAAAELHGDPCDEPSRLRVKGKGWKDADLPELFRAIDRHAENLFARYQAEPATGAYEVAP